MPRQLLFLCFALSSIPALGTDFNNDIRPILKARCLQCHGPDDQQADLRLDLLSTDLVKNAKGAESWHDVMNALNKNEMPPEDADPLTPQERQRLTGWIANQLDLLKKARRSTGGTVVLRRLNRFEYQNTMTDLLGVELNYSENLPPDPISEDGFRNNGAALKMSSMQLEYYLKAARRGLQTAIVEGTAPEVFEHQSSTTDSDKGKGNWTDRLGRTGQFVMRVPEFPDTGEFVIRATVRTEVPDGAAYPVLQVKLGYRSDVRAPATVVATVDVADTQSQEIEFRGRLEEFPIQTRSQSKYPGMLIWLENVYSDGRPDPKPTKKVIEDSPKDDQKKKKKKRTQTVWPEDPDFPKIVVESVSFNAPVYTQWPPRHHTGIIAEPPKSAADETSAARRSLREFLPRAFRRPVTKPDVDIYLKYYAVVRPEAGTFESAMREVCAMALVSPDFLYLPESSATRLNDFEIATRMSYFLWSTMPDRPLLKAAEDHLLTHNGTLRQQVDRMLAAPQSTAFVNQFARQWLDLDGVDRVAVNPEFYPDFDNALKPLMVKETQAFLGHILHHNKSCLQLLNADFTLLNEPLARHYGLSGPRGWNQFERVSLTGTHRRGGLLAHASILMANSTGDDSHPIKRAVWIRERLLDDPPAPPPPDVPDLNQDLPELVSLPLKEQLRLHLENEACAACHRGLDPWGVALDGFDAVGLSRDVIRRRHPKKRGTMIEHPVDAQTELPDGTSIDGLDELQQYLVTHKREEFARTLVVKLLSYGLGRSVEFTDEDLIDSLTQTFADHDYRLKDLIAEIVCSEAFQK